MLAEPRDQLPEVLHHIQEVVAVDTGWLLRVTVATHVQGNHVVILNNDNKSSNKIQNVLCIYLVEVLDLVSPYKPELWEAMYEEYERFAGVP